MQSLVGLKHIEYSNYNFMFSWEHEDICHAQYNLDQVKSG